MVIVKFASEHAKKILSKWNTRCLQRGCNTQFTGLRLN